MSEMLAFCNNLPFGNVLSVAQVHSSPRAFSRLALMESHVASQLSLPMMTGNAVWPHSISPVRPLLLSVGSCFSQTFSKSSVVSLRCKSSPQLKWRYFKTRLAQPPGEASHLLSQDLASTACSRTWLSLGTSTLDRNLSPCQLFLYSIENYLSLPFKLWNYYHASRKLWLGLNVVFLQRTGKRQYILQTKAVLIEFAKCLWRKSGCFHGFCHWEPVGDLSWIGDSMYILSWVVKCLSSKDTRWWKV